MNKMIILLVLINILLYSKDSDKPINIGNKISITSNILEEKRFFNVYIPPSYKLSNLSTYPVIYLMDGDYNFHHVTGLVEQLSSISEKIPEMIVVGISDNGHTSYQKNCIPSNESEIFLEFFNKELKPYIENNYKTADLDILIGHSLGGLFTINTLLTKPESFDAYIAISPSLWWNDYESEKNVKSFFENRSNLNKFLYLSVGNERGMGIFGFYDQLDVNTFADDYYKNEPLGIDFTFKHYPNENHNSVGLITVKEALEKMFNNYDLSASVLNKISTFGEYEKIMLPHIKKIGSGFSFPKGQLNSILRNIYQNNKEELETFKNEISTKYKASLGNFNNSLGNLLIKNDEIKKGLEILKINSENNPNSPEFLTSLADAYFKNSQLNEAKKYYEMAYKTALEQKTRNWYLNQLKANVIK